MALNNHPGSGERFVSRGVFQTRPRRVLHKFQAVGLVVALGFTGFADVNHSIVSGDNLSRLARRYGVTVKAIASANGIRNLNLIRIGKKIKIPGKGRPAAGKVSVASTKGAGPSFIKHKVALGENLSLIARRYGTTSSSLIKLNALKQPNLLRPGFVLNVPAPGSPSVRPASAPSAAANVPVPAQPLNLPPRPPVTTVSAPEPGGVEQVIERYSRRYGVDPSLMKGLAWQESGWKQHVVSSAGAIGVMQVLPQTGEFIAKHLLKEPVNLNNREQNIKAGVRFFAFYLSKTNGDEATAVAGYFQGLRSVWQNGISEATKKYVAAVLALRHRFPTPAA